MNKILTSVVTLLIMSGVASAQQQSKSDEKVEFRPHWSMNVQGGASYTVGEAKFGELLSPAAQLTASYNFHHAMSVRFGLSGWQGKGTVVVTEEIYRFKFAQLSADYVLDLANLFGGFKHDRIWTPYVFAGIGGAYGFDNEARNYVQDYSLVVNKCWETAPFFVVRAGLGADFWVAENVAIGLEANTNTYGDKFNSKGAVKGFNPDFQFNALLGLKLRFGGNTAPSQAYAAAQAAAAAAAAQAALEKAEAERLAAEKAAAEKAAAEKAAAEKAAAEKAAAEKAAAEKAAEEHKALAIENTQNIFFSIGSSVITKENQKKLETLAQWMVEHQNFNLLIIGYADKQTGTDAVNQRVSAARAKAVKDFLVKNGVAAERIDAEYKGATEQPFAENDKNRVVICSLQ